MAYILVFFEFTFEWSVPLLINELNTSFDMCSFYIFMIYDFIHLKMIF